MSHVIVRREASEDQRELRPSRGLHALDGAGCGTACGLAKLGDSQRWVLPPTAKVSRLREAAAAVKRSG
jgi:hypothetical protein